MQFTDLKSFCDALRGDIDVRFQRLLQYRQHIRDPKVMALRVAPAASAGVAT